jgi:hypothetical protein
VASGDAAATHAASEITAKKPFETPNPIFPFYRDGDLYDNTEMGINPRVSKKTLIFGSLIAMIAAFIGLRASFAGTDGTPDAERARLEEEMAAARNALDVLVLQPGTKLDDPRVRAKAATVGEKTQAYRNSFLEAQKGPPRPTSYPNLSPGRPNGERDEPDDGHALPAVTSASNPAGMTSTVPPASTSESAGAASPTVLSAEGVAKEITYSKKTGPGKSAPRSPRPSPRFDHAEEAVPVATAAPDAAGLSEIEYPKKKKP